MKSLAKKIWIMLCMAVLVGSIMGFPVRAEEVESITILKMVTAGETTVARVAPDDNAEILTTYEAGDDILVVEEIDEEWYSIAYQAQIGYVRRAYTEDKVTDVEAIQEEFAAAEYETDLWVEEVEKEREESRQARIWGIVIAVLVIAIFGIGIVNTVMKKGKKDDE